MGMYDYLGEEQVKIFYIPIFSEKDETGWEDAGTWHSGGMLRYFKIEDSLPLQTIYYKYPCDFLVYDIMDKRNFVYIILNGKFMGYKDITELTSEYLLKFNSIYDNYGNLLNINKLNDFEDIKLEFHESRKKYLEKRNEIMFFIKDTTSFKEWWNSFGSENQAKHNFEKLQKKSDEEALPFINNFNSKWIKTNNKIKLMKLGELIECFLNFYKNNESNEEIKCNKRFLSCSLCLKEFIDSNEGILMEYLDWLETKEIDLNTLNNMYNHLSKICN